MHPKRSRLISSAQWRASLIAFLVSFSISVHNVVGRRCVCTSKACKEAGVDMCRTRFSCYTEDIYSIDGTAQFNSSTRGCTEGATPLLCETKSWTRSTKRGSMGVGANELDPSGSRLQMSWPRLKCCDSHDYCNSGVTMDHHANKNNGTRTNNVISLRDKTSSSSSSTRPDEGEEARTRVLVATSQDRRDPIESPAASASSGSDRASSTNTIGAAVEDRGGWYDPLRHRIRPLHVAAVVLAIAALTSVLGACYVITSCNTSTSHVQ